MVNLTEGYIALLRQLACFARLGRRSLDYNVTGHIVTHRNCFVCPETAQKHQKVFSLTGLKSILDVYMFKISLKVMI